MKSIYQKCDLYNTFIKFFRIERDILLYRQSDIELKKSNYQSSSEPVWKSGILEI